MTTIIEKEELICFLKEKLKISRRNLASNIQLKVYKNSLIEHTNFLPLNSKYSQRCWHLIYEINQQPLCKTCNINVPKFNNNKWDYLDYCSIKCQGNSKQVRQNYENAIMKKYGKKNILQVTEIKEKIKKTMLNRYGVDHNSKGSFKEKRVLSCIKKYNKNYYLQTEDAKQKNKKYCFEKYGVTHYSKTNEFKNKYKKTCIEKFGVEHPMHDPYIIEEVLKKLHKFKDYLLPSGKIIHVMGYENVALDFLLKKYNENDILTEKHKIREITGPIEYDSITKRKRIYFPDFFNIKENMIIEVKSTWTFDKCGKLNELNNENIMKKDACLKLGYKFKFMIMSHDNLLNEFIYT